MFWSGSEGSGKGWTRWARGAFPNGAGNARKIWKIRALQEVADFSSAGRRRSFQRVDDCEAEWKEIWDMRSCAAAVAGHSQFLCRSVPIAPLHLWQSR